MTHDYYCEGQSETWVVKRKTKPRIGQIITSYGDKWEVWYVEEKEGKCRARLERVGS